MKINKAFTYKKKNSTIQQEAQQITPKSEPVDKSKGDEMSEEEESKPVKKRRFRVKYNPKS
jgi:hypothetical protein